MPLFSKPYNIIFLLIGLVMAISCKKNSQFYPKQEFLISSSETSIQSIYFLNDSTWFTCGGIPNKSGFLSLSTNKGKNWTKLYENNEFCLNTINFSTKSVGFCGGDKLLMLKTKDGGKTWKDENYLKPYPEMTLSIRKIFFVDSTFGAVVSGNNHEKGSTFKLYKNEFGNKYYEFNRGFSDLYYFNKQEGLYCANGAIYKTSDGGDNYLPCAINGDFFIGITSYQNLTWVCGYNGGIYKTVDRGLNWETIQKPNKANLNRKNYTCIYSNKNTIICGGTNGIITYSINDGIDWNTIYLESKQTINCISQSNDNYYAACAKGKIVSFKIN